MRTKTFSLEDVKHVATLAQLKLAPEEEKTFAPQLASIIGYISKLSEVSTEGVEPTSQVTGLVNVFREDEIDISRMLTQEEALKNAPVQHNGYFMVKAIFE